VVAVRKPFNPISAFAHEGISVGREPSRSNFYVPVWYSGTAEERSPTPSNTVVGTEGMAITFADGTTLEDWTGHMYVNNIGTGRPDVAKVLADAAIRTSWLSPSEFAAIRLDLTEDLRSVLPRNLTTPFYGIGGSDSNEAAIRAAWQVTKRRKVLSFTSAYHGDTITIESVTGGVEPYGDLRRWACTPRRRTIASTGWVIGIARTKRASRESSGV